MHPRMNATVTVATWEIEEAVELAWSAAAQQQQPETEWPVDIHSINELIRSVNKVLVAQVGEDPLAADFSEPILGRRWMLQWAGNLIRLAQVCEVHGIDLSAEIGKMAHSRLEGLAAALLGRAAMQPASAKQLCPLLDRALYEIGEDNAEEKLRTAICQVTQRLSGIPRQRASTHE